MTGAALFIHRALVLLLFGSTAVRAAALDEFTPVNDAVLREPPATDWLSYRGNYQSWGYSALESIHRQNVAELAFAWAASMEPGANESTPLVRNGTMFLPHPGDVIEALDARDGARLWLYRRARPEDVHRPNEQGGVVAMLLADIKRNLALYDERVFTITADHHVVAIDVHRGAEVWATRVGDYRQMASSSGPIVADGRVITGRSCDPSYAGGCFITAHDAQNGKELWREHLVPRPGEPGDDTWSGLAWEKRVHVGAWGVPSYDPSLGLLYVGTSVPAPSVELLRGTPGGDLLYSNSTLALDVRTGRRRWHFQHLPRDNWDMDHVFERILVDVPQRPDPDAVWAISPELETGALRRVLTGVPGKTGIVWTLDRTTGAFLWARPTVAQNLISAIDASTGRPRVDERRILKSTDDRYPEICPSAYGGKNWPVSAYSPRTRALFVPLYGSCQSVTVTTLDPKPADLYGLDWVVRPEPDAASTGQLEAISVETGRTLWRHKQAGRVFNVLATAGDLVFAGDSRGLFMALDAETGHVLWRTQLHASVSGAPISYAIDGVQYVAVAAGGGDTLTDVANAVSGSAARGRGNMLYAFRLPGGAPLAQRTTGAPLEGLGPRIAAPLTHRPDVANGRAIYESKCAACHGNSLRGSGRSPGLVGCAFSARWGQRSIAELYQKILRSMPPYPAESLSEAHAVDVVAFLISASAGNNSVPALSRWSNDHVGQLLPLCSEGSSGPSRASHF